MRKILQETESVCVVCVASYRNKANRARFITQTKIPYGRFKKVTKTLPKVYIRGLSNVYVVLIRKKNSSMKALERNMRRLKSGKKFAFSQWLNLIPKKWKRNKNINKKKRENKTSRGPQRKFRHYTRNGGESRRHLIKL